MNDELIKSYQTHLLILFKNVRKHFKSNEFGAERAIISTTTPIMILETWRADGHENDIPLLNECAKNTILASAAVILGWKKTAYLQLRVSLESILYGVILLKDKKVYEGFLKNGTVPYRKFPSLLKEFTNFNSITKNVETEFKIADNVNAIYTDLSEWSHTLGTQFASDLSILAESRIKGKAITETKEKFRSISRYGTIIYLSIRPSILSDLSHANQRYLLQNLSIPERERLRDLLNT
jgi:hypothetical protein